MSSGTSKPSSIKFVPALRHRGSLEHKIGFDLATSKRDLEALTHQEKTDAKGGIVRGGSLTSNPTASTTSSSRRNSANSSSSGDKTNSSRSSRSSSGSGKQTKLDQFYSSASASPAASSSAALSRPRLRQATMFEFPELEPLVARAVSAKQQQRRPPRSGASLPSSTAPSSAGARSEMRRGVKRAHSDQDREDEDEDEEHLQETAAGRTASMAVVVESQSVEMESLSKAEVPKRPRIDVVPDDASDGEIDRSDNDGGESAHGGMDTGNESSDSDAHSHVSNSPRTNRAASTARSEWGAGDDGLFANTDSQLSAILDLSTPPDLQEKLIIRPVEQRVHVPVDIKFRRGVSVGSESDDRRILCSPQGQHHADPAGRFAARAAEGVGCTFESQDSVEGMQGDDLCEGEADPAAPEPQCPEPEKTSPMTTSSRHDHHDFGDVPASYVDPCSLDMNQYPQFQEAFRYANDDSSQPAEDTGPATSATAASDASAVFQQPRRVARAANSARAAKASGGVPGESDRADEAEANGPGSLNAQLHQLGVLQGPSERPRQAAVSGSMDVLTNYPVSAWQPSANSLYDDELGAELAADGRQRSRAPRSTKPSGRCEERSAPITAMPSTFESVAASEDGAVQKTVAPALSCSVGSVSSGSLEGSVAVDPSASVESVAALKPIIQPVNISEESAELSQELITSDALMEERTEQRPGQAENEDGAADSQEDTYGTSASLARGETLMLFGDFSTTTGERPATALSILDAPSPPDLHALSSDLEGMEDALGSL